MAHLNQALTLWRGGKCAEAELKILEWLRDRPEDPAALRPLAEIYTASGRARQAIPLWRRLSGLSPADAAILRQLAHVLIAEQAYGEAIEVLRSAISIDPASARAYNNLGLAQLRTGDAAGAAASLESAVTLDPAYGLGHMNLGLALQSQNRFAEARMAFERALQVEPHLSVARLHLSELLRTEDAAAARRQRDQALESHGINLMTERRHEEAVAVWSRLIESGADVPCLEGMRFHCRLHCCDWDQYPESVAQLESAVLEGRPVDLPFSFFVYSNSAAAQLRCAQTYIAARYPAMADSAPHALRSDHSHRSQSRRIRIAYLSFDFYDHATARLVAGLFESHDRSRFEVFALSYGPSDGSVMRTRLEESVEHFRDVGGQTDLEIAGLVRSLGIDIAIDLKGLTGGARTGIFARRAAPLQINFLGYPGTMGAPYIDYLIADAQLIPAHEQGHYSEQIIYMPKCYQPNDSKRPRPFEGPGRERLGLPARAFVYCCFNHLYKITPAVFAAWMGLLREVGGSVLWLLEGTPAAMRNLRRAAANCSVAPERLLFAPHIEPTQHLARYLHADVFLDTTPCNAHTTASDALWMGVPVVTVTGQTFAGRVATSLLHAAGLPQLCAGSLEEYAALALRMAWLPEELAALKAHLESGHREFRLFDSSAYCRDLETAYAEIWSRHARGKRPSALVIEGAAPPAPSGPP